MWNEYAASKQLREIEERPELLQRGPGLSPSCRNFFVKKKQAKTIHASLFKQYLEFYSCQIAVFSWLFITAKRRPYHARHVMQ